MDMIRHVARNKTKGEGMWHAARFAESLASFRKTLAPEYWLSLRHRLSQMVVNGEDFWGAGKDEIGFVICGGIYGAMINRGEDFSSHT